ncbi:SGNH/GDSL hydrolase family protein [Streptomyces sp. NPDC046859]|uniref:SGNH/GDSL hydrolase family protein n=1 Tax=Streptomyces sp. NPDC046859 TaxID=3155734 RepID=UPI003400BA9A
MRRLWCVGVVLGAALLGACGDPASRPASAPSEVPAASATTDQPAPSSPRVPPRARPRPAKPPGVLYLGDSLAMEAQRVLGRELRRELGAVYSSAPYSGTTPCDYLEGTGARSLVPAADKAAALVRRLRPDFVVLQFWGNAWGYTPCMAGITHDASPRTYFARYSADLERLGEQITAAYGGARIVWVLQGPDPVTPDRVRRVNDLYERRAAASGDLVSDAGASVSAAGARYTWVRYLPCTPFERGHPPYCTEPGRDRTALHRDDDPLHFCLAPTTTKPRPCPVRSPGILRITREITRTLRANP